MSENDRPPERTPESVPPESAAPPSPSAKDERRRRRLEGVIPELVRRAVELGVEKTLEAPDNVKQFVGDMKLPKEIAHYVFQQIDETKNGLFRVVAKEIRDFLEHTNFAGEVQKLLTTVQFEVNTTIRFTPNDGRSNSPGAGAKKGASQAPPPGKRKRDEAAAAGGEAPAEDPTEPEEENAQPGPAPHTTSLPRPEVKTNVHLHRDREATKRKAEREDE